MPKSVSVLKPSDSVLKCAAQIGIETRFATVASEIKELTSALISNEVHRFLRCKKKDGLGRIRTGDLRHVKANFLGSAASQIIRSHRHNQLNHEPSLVPQVLSELALPFTEEESTSYAERRKYGLSEYPIDWIDRSQKAMWVKRQQARV